MSGSVDEEVDPAELRRQRLARFRAFFQELVRDHKIRIGAGKRIDAQRVAFLCATELVRMYGHQFGMDAEYEFFIWAKRIHLRCAELTDRERRGKRYVDKPYSHTYYKLFPKLTFAKFTDIATELLTVPSGRTPVRCRTPVTQWNP